MSKKKKKKSPAKSKPVEEKSPETQAETCEVQIQPITCTCVGRKMRPSGAGFAGIVKSQRYVKNLGMLLLYFENGYCCNAEICTLSPSKE